MKKDILKISSITLSMIAILIGLVSITMNVMSRQFESNDTAEQNINYVAPEEQITVMNLLVAGSVNTNTWASNYHYSALEDPLANAQLSVYLQKSLVNVDSNSAIADQLIQYGVDFVGLANESSFSHGREGIETTLSYWNEQTAMTAGVHLSTDDANKVTMITEDDLSIAFLSFTDILNDVIPEQQSYCVNLFDEERSAQMVSRAADASDVVIVEIVWEGMDQSLPTDRQKEIAQILADAGASVIIGNASDAIQPIAWIDDTLIFYSVGSLIEQPGSMGILGSVTITKTTLADKKRVELTNPKADFIQNVQNSDGSYDIVWLEQVDANAYEEKKGVLHWLDDSIRIGGLQ